MRPLRRQGPASGSLLSRACTLAGLLALLCAASAQAQTVLYASPNGSSSGTCTVSIPCNLTQAQAYVRTLTPSMSSDIIVNLAAGTYTLSSTWAFTNADSGTGGYTVIWQASGYGTGNPATVTISGGTQVTGWTLWDSGKNIWKAREPYNTRQLYVNGIRAQRATGPFPVTLTLNGTTGFTASSSAMASWHNISNIEFIFHEVNYIERRCQVSSISGTAINMDNPCFTNIQVQVPPSQLIPVALENAYELLTQPGQWYFDSTGTIDGSGFTTMYYIPRAGESMSTATVIAPVLQTLLSGTGTLASPLLNVQFKGLTFAYATWIWPSSSDGYAETGGNMYVTGPNPYGDPLTLCCSIDVSKVPGNIAFSAAHNVRLEGNLFTHLGAVGVTFEYGSQNDTVIGNEFTDISGTSLRVGDPNDYNPTDTRARLVSDTIQDNYMHDTLIEYPSAGALEQIYSQDDVITHNQLDDLPYVGLTTNWGANGVTTYTQGNSVTDNLIYNTMQVFSDGGSIYQDGTQGPNLASGELIDGNVLHDQPTGGFALYTDVGSQYITLQNNVVYNMGAGVPSWGGCFSPASAGGGFMTFQNNYIPEASTFSGSWPCGAAPSGGLGTANNTQIASLGACTGIPACQSIVNNAGVQPEYQCLLTASCAGVTTTTVDDSAQGAGLNQFSYVGTSWGHCVGASGCFTVDTTYENSASYGTTTNDYALFKFTGDQVNFYGVRDPTHQMIALSICDQNGANCGSETIVDQYAPVRQGNVLQWSSPVLGRGTYTLKMRITGTHNPAAHPDASGFYYNLIDRVDVITLPTTTYDDSLQGTGVGQFNYAGASWGHCTSVATCGSSAYYNNSASWATATNDYVLFKFTGTRVLFYGSQDIHNQMVGLSICDQNGANCGTETIVDQYANVTSQGNVLQWTSPALTSGTYTLKVRITGQHNPNAVPDNPPQYYGIVDRVDVQQ